MMCAGCGNSRWWWAQHRRRRPSCKSVLAAPPLGLGLDRAAGVTRSPRCVSRVHSVRGLRVGCCLHLYRRCCGVASCAASTEDSTRHITPAPSDAGAMKQDDDDASMELSTEDSSGDEDSDIQVSKNEAPAAPRRQYIQ